MSLQRRRVRFWCIMEDGDWWEGRRVNWAYRQWDGGVAPEKLCQAAHVELEMVAESSR